MATSSVAAARPTLPRIRETVVKGAPRTPAELREVLWRAFRVRVPDVKVCEHHSTPWAAFCDAFFARAPVVVWKGSRGLAGKTFSLGLLATASGLFLKADVNLLGGSGQQSKLGLKYVSDNLTESNIVAGGAVADVAHETRLKNGAVIRALMASQTSVRGPHPQRLLLDEADEMSLPILDSALGQPMARDGIRSQVVISSTHQYPDGTFSEVLRRAAERGWPVHEFCFHETSAPPHGWLTSEMISDARDRVTAAMWETEFELQEPSPEGRAIDTEAVRRMFRADLGDFPGLEGERVEIEPPQAGARYAHGADWARKVDYTAVATLRIDCVPYRLVAYRCMQRRPWPDMVAELDQRMDRYGGVACHDGTGLGDVVGSMLKLDAEAVLMVGRDRRDILSEYCVAIERGEIEAPMIRSMEAEHRYASVDALYGAGHPPDSIVAGALAYRAARRGTLAASSSSEEADSRLRAGYGRLLGQRSGLMGGRLR